MSNTSKSGRHAKGKSAVKSAKRKSSPLVAGAAVAKVEPIAAHAAVEPIGLDKLARSEKNARKTNKTNGIDSLAASIAAIGVIENLAVIPEGKAGHFAVIAGDRRLQALWKLRDEGRIPADHPVDCRVYATESAVIVSTSENVQREPMHPADACEAFQQMLNEGGTISSVATSFGASEQTVRQHLKIANVAPQLVKAFRAGQATLAQMMALAITDDHKRQLRVWKNAQQDWQRSPDTLRRQLTTGEVNGTSPLARFVGVDAYRAAGGFVREDLFTEGAEGRYFGDAELLESLALAKLEEQRDTLQAEGWSWVDVRTTLQNRYEYEQCGVTARKATPEEAERVKVLTSERAELLRNDEMTDDEDARLNAVDTELATIRVERERFSKDAKAIAGAIITIEANGNRAGSLLILRGLIRPEDRKAAEKARKAKAKAKANGKRGETGGASADADAGAGAELSDALVHALTTERTLAMRALLVGAPLVALRAAVHAIVVGSLYERNGAHEGIAVSTACHSIRLVPEAEQRCQAALRVLDEATTAARAQLPEDVDALWSHLATLDVDALLALLAVAMAPTLDATRAAKGYAPKAVAEGVAQAVGLDMAAWWVPTPENYLARVNKTLIIEAVTEACGADAAKPLAAMKKGDAVAEATRLLNGKVWLPTVLRT